MTKSAIFIILFITIGIFPDEEKIFFECKNDQEKFCKGILKPKARIIQCLLENKSELTESCRAALKSLSEKNSHKMRKICSDDVSKFCKWVIPGNGRIIKCLFANETSLSEVCKKAMNE